MKTARFVLKLVALGLTVASTACLIVAYWDKISEFVGALIEKLEGKLECRKPCCCHDAEFEDYADSEL